jgi:hypothetical protein
MGTAEAGRKAEVVISYTLAAQEQTQAPSAVTQTSATLNAVVNPDGAEVTECKFEYGTTESFGSSVPCSALPESGSNAVAVSAPVGDLLASTTYYFRIVAANAGGTTYGGVIEFATPMATPAAPQEPGSKAPTVYGAVPSPGPVITSMVAPLAPITSAPSVHAKLVRALKTCKKRYKRNRKKRVACEKQAKKKYGPKPKRR